MAKVHNTWKFYNGFIEKRCPNRDCKVCTHLLEYMVTVFYYYTKNEIS